MAPTLADLITSGTAASDFGPCRPDDMGLFQGGLPIIKWLSWNQTIRMDIHIQHISGSAAGYPEQASAPIADCRLSI